MGVLKSKQASHFDFTVNLPSNLLQLMNNKNISGSDLARALDLPYNTIKRITSGETTDPKISTLNLIADFFGVGIDELLGNDTQQNSNHLSSNRPSSVPILSWQDLEKSNLINTITPNNWTNWHPVALPKGYHLSKNSFAIESRKSMQPRFPTGTMFIIDPDERPEDGDLVLIKINETGELTLKELEIDPPAWKLFSVNDDLTPSEFNKEEYTLSGVVIFTALHSR